MAWHVRLLGWLPWVFLPATAVLALLVGRYAVVTFLCLGAYSVWTGALYIARPSAWDELVRWRESASPVALLVTGFTRDSQHESRTVAGGLRILVGLGFVALAILVLASA